MKRILIMVLVCFIMLAGTAFAKSGTLLVAFGTSIDRAKVALDDIEDAYRQSIGKSEPLVMAYTSDIIRNKLAKQGILVFSVNAAMNELAKQGVTELDIQSLHVAPAQEYNQLERMIVKNVTKYPGRFKTVKLGYPLLVSKKDLDDVVAIVLASLPKERKPNEAVVLMGHGNNHGPGDIPFIAVAAAFQKADPNVWFANVEGAVTFSEILPKIVESTSKKVWLMPFMIVAGDHSINDLTGPEADSWASQLKAAGMTTVPLLNGLGQLDGIQKVFLRHTENAVTDFVNNNKAD